MKLRIVVLALSALIFSTCKDSTDVSPNPTVLMTLNVDPSFITSETDNWIVIHDANGDLVDYKSYESGDQYVFQTDKTVSGDLTITTIAHNVATNGRKSYVVSSYTDVAKGKILTLKSSVLPIQGTKTGEFTVEVSGLAPIDEYTLTSKYSSSGSATYTSNFMSIQSDIFVQPSEYILQISTYNQLRYKTFQNVEDGKTYKISFEEMLPFDQTIEISFPTCSDVTAFVLGAESPDTSVGNQYNLFVHLNGDQHAGLKLGFLNEFANYRTILNLSYDNYELFYDKFGPSPEFIAWPNPLDYAATSKSITNFVATAKTPALWRTSSWQYSSAEAPYDIVNWSVSSPSLTHAINAMPADLISPHPLLAFDKLTYLETIFNTQGQTYERYMDWLFAGKGVNINESVRVGVH